jgi:hypothetical protein
LVSLARTLLLRSWPNISLPFWGKEACGLLHDGSRFARCHSVRMITISWTYRSRQPPRVMRHSGAAS